MNFEFYILWQKSMLCETNFWGKISQSTFAKSIACICITKIMVVRPGLVTLQRSPPCRVKRYNSIQILPHPAPIPTWTSPPTLKWWAGCCRDKCTITIASASCSCNTTWGREGEFVSGEVLLWPVTCRACDLRSVFVLHTNIASQVECPSPPGTQTAREQL